MEELIELLFSKLKTLNETIWEGKVNKPRIEEWLDNFAEDRPGTDSERLHVLYLLRQFMYFGDRQIRELLKALYRDLYKYPIVEQIRKNHSDTSDSDFIFKAFCEELSKTRFLGMGNPSESGYYLLYYFRQENNLPKTLFIHGHQIFNRYGAPIDKRGCLLQLKSQIFNRHSASASAMSLRDTDVKRYVFIDDLCGSGTQAKDYSEQILQDLKRLDPRVEVSYYTLFATTDGLNDVRGNTLFDRVESIFELDDTFRVFSSTSRYFQPADSRISLQFAEATCRKYGSVLLPGNSLGYKNGQLLLGLHHNTPDNSLPIFWYDEPDVTPWVPIFRRYPKYYGWA